RRGGVTTGGVAPTSIARRTGQGLEGNRIPIVPARLTAPCRLPAEKHHPLRDHLRNRPLLPVLLVRPAPNRPLHAHLPPLPEMLRARLALPPMHHDVVPLDVLLPLVVAVRPHLVRRQREPRHRLPARERVRIGITA